MPKWMSLPNITKRCSQGVTTAEAKYKEWSGGRPGYSAPESLVQIEIASLISSAARQEGGFITLEENEVSILSAANAHHRAKTKRSGRVDIVMWNGGHNIYPRILIETKKLRTTKSANSDVIRIVHLMKLCKTIQCSIFVGYALRANKTSIVVTKFFDKVEKEVRAKIPEEKLTLNCVRAAEISSTGTFSNAPRSLGTVVFVIKRRK